jgi:predicted pyridoxine 5'-phosphate oxidase superfamily flavin-nucleotide-binding protein
MDTLIRTSEQLQACVGRLPGARDAKVIDHLDDGARRWIARSPLLFAALEVADGMQVTLAGGPAGFASTGDPGRLSVPRRSLDDPDLAAAGRGFGGLFVVPGLGETLRVNGTVEGVGGDWLEVRVEECYLHCAKALIRSRFWEGSAASDVPGEASALLANARFLALATSDGRDHADLSPKGDPAGLLVQVHAGRVSFADRPGNRRVDSFLNILEHPRVALAALVPGHALVAVVRGAAVLSRDEALRAAFAVEGRMPKLVAQVEGAQVWLRHSAALQRAALWPAAPAPDDLDPAALFAGHVRASRGRDAGTLAAKALASIPGLVRKGLEYDYKKNLY